MRGHSLETKEKNKRGRLHEVLLAGHSAASSVTLKPTCLTIAPGWKKGEGTGAEAEGSHIEGRDCGLRPGHEQSAGAVFDFDAWLDEHLASAVADFNA